MKIINIAILIAAVILSCLLILSCRSVKEVTKTETSDDLAHLKELEEWKRKYKMDSAGWTNMIEMLSENTIIFQDTGITREVPVIKYRSDGSIEEVRGNLKSVTSRYSKSQQEAAYWKSVADSISRVKSRDSTRVKKEYYHVETKKKVTVLPWWLFLVAACVLIVGWKLGKIKKFM